MYKSPSNLTPDSRRTIAAGLNARLADGLDLHLQTKVAHWNVKGPLFPSLHPLFEQFAISLAGFNDAVAERAVTLGGTAVGTVRQVAATSLLPELPGGVVRGLDLVSLLADRIDAYLGGPPGDAGPRRRPGRRRHRRPAHPDRHRVREERLVPAGHRRGRLTWT